MPTRSMGWLPKRVSADQVQRAMMLDGAHSRSMAAITRAAIAQPRPRKEHLARADLAIRQAENGGDDQTQQQARQK